MKEIILGTLGILAALLAFWLVVIAIIASISEHRSNKNMSHGCKERWGKNGCG